MIRRRDDCQICHGFDLDKVIPLKPIPIITPNIGVGSPLDFNTFGGPTVPLDVYLCRDCGHLQLLDIVDPNLQYTNFKYRTSISLGLAEHFDLMADHIVRKLRLQPKSFVVEIGSNDGTLLQAFKRRGMKVLGIDPAIAIAEQARADGVDTLPLFFNHPTAMEIRAGYGRADLIVCANTMANVDDLDSFFGGIDILLKQDGVFVLETQYGADVVRKLLIETIYHEHLAYFMIAPLRYLCKRHGFHLKTIEYFETKGGSIRCYVFKNGQVADSDVYKSMSVEIGSFRLPTNKVYEQFNRFVADTTTKLADVLTSRTGVAGYGASVGTITLLNQFDLGKKLIMLIDDNPLTDRMRGLDYDLPVVTPQQMLQTKEFLHIDTIVVLAWRYAKQIISRYKQTIESGEIQLIVPWPTLFVHGKGK